MTAATINAEFVVVNIVGTVAAAAAAINKFHFLDCAAVAVIASDLYVRALQRKFGLHVMVEVPQIPCNRIVAGVTTTGETAAVRVIHVVAASTLRFHLFVSLRRVTKKDRILPVDFGMAELTQGAK